ncbi:MAG: glycoside hydrolase family 57 [Anaerolineae bacterium]|nr:glycoside hydrolase family 57 [Anaerolineae bacterium]
MDTIFHALVLNLHQPSGNLEDLLEHEEWEAKEILWALDRMPRSLWGYEDIARVHLSMSGTLLETLSSPEFQNQVYGIVKIGDLLWYLQNTKIFEILGTGYYHPVLPLIPPTDWDPHIERWQTMGRHVFWQENFSGFWPPEMGFCMEMIPTLKKFGYRYVIVDSKHVEPTSSMRWEEVRYRPHLAEYQGHEIVVVVRDRELSDAQESGMEYGWFEHEVHERTKWCDFPPLVTTATDGDNGGWFRNTHPKGNFWYVFYREFLDQIRNDWTVVRPTFISDYLDKYGAEGYVRVNTGAWNTGWHSGIDFVQWTGSKTQKETLRRIHQTSAALHALFKEAGPFPNDPQLRLQLSEAHWHLLRAETSCNLFWGETWVDRAHKDLDAVWFNIDEARKRL